MDDPPPKSGVSQGPPRSGVLRDALHAAPFAPASTPGGIPESVETHKRHEVGGVQKSRTRRHRPKSAISQAVPDSTSAATVELAPVAQEAISTAAPSDSAARNRQRRQRGPKPTASAAVTDGSAGSVQPVPAVDAVAAPRPPQRQRQPRPQQKPAAVSAGAGSAAAAAPVAPAAVAESTTAPASAPIDQTQRPRRQRLRGSRPAAATAPSIAAMAAAAAAAATTATPDSALPPPPSLPAAPRVTAASAAAPRKPRPPRTPKMVLSAELLQDQTERAADMLQRLSSEEYECLVCYDYVRRRDQTYACEQCYAVFHAKCIKHWSETGGSTEGGWRCPQCQHVTSNPPQPSCYCGQIRSPNFDPYVPPHSCGETCGKQRAEGCPHPCPLMCHPGPCPPCSAMAPPRPCYCGKQTLRQKCGTRIRSCGALCDRPLSCGAHQCDEVCHDGPCPPCDVTTSVLCFCGKETRELPCGQTEFSCEQVCDAVLDCSNHKCEALCHRGACKPCALTPQRVRTCPCGKASVASLAAPRSSCLDPVPCCTARCDKLLPCGHRCQSQCHVGDCPSCQVTVRRPCRCGADQRETACGATETLCHRECAMLRSCGRHRCNTVCCPMASLPHQCPLLCNKPLQCGTHRCSEPCHKGRCAPCLLAVFSELSCRCGKTVLLPPQPCGTQPPPCMYPCSIPQACGHAPHHNCHLVDKCPPCPVLVSRMCDGGHEVRHNVRCGTAHVSCGRPCGRPLRCGLHTCERTCHAGPCVKSYPTGKTCGKRCDVPMPCGHKCPALCHPGAACPNEPCKEQITLYCACQRRSAQFVCGTPTDVLSCDDDCEQAARTRAFASALGLMPTQPTAAAGTGSAASGTTGTEAVVQQSGYEPELIDLARRAPHFVATVERYLVEFARAKDSQEMSLPAMDGEQRKLVHTLAAHFDVGTVSRGWEAERHVVLQRTERTHIPRIPLSFFSDVLRTHALRVTGLTSAVRTADLMRPLQTAGLHQRVRIVWVDDRTALVCCDAPDTLVRARQTLQPLFPMISVVDAADVEQAQRPAKHALADEPQSQVGNDVWNEGGDAPAAAAAAAAATTQRSPRGSSGSEGERPKGEWRRRFAPTAAPPASGIRLSTNPFAVLSGVASDTAQQQRAATTATAPPVKDALSLSSLVTALPATTPVTDASAQSDLSDSWVLATPPTPMQPTAAPASDAPPGSGVGSGSDEEEDWERVEVD